MRESGENYLETILLLTKERGTVRAVDVARELGYSKASVSRALASLQAEGYVEVTSGGKLELTTFGKRAATELLHKHTEITRFLMMTTNVPQEIAEAEACKMEHYINDATFTGMKNFMRQVDELNK